MQGDGDQRPNRGWSRGLRWANGKCGTKDQRSFETLSFRAPNRVIARTYEGLYKLVGPVGPVGPLPRLGWVFGKIPALVPLVPLVPGGNVGKDVIWRVGRKLGRTIYIQKGDEPSDDDQFIGVMDTPELAQIVVVAVNRVNSRA